MSVPSLSRRFKVVRKKEVYKKAGGARCGNCKDFVREGWPHGSDEWHVGCNAPFEDSESRLFCPERTLAAPPPRPTSRILISPWCHKSAQHSQLGYLQYWT